MLATQLQLALHVINLPTRSMILYLTRRHVQMQYWVLSLLPSGQHSCFICNTDHTPALWYARTSLPLTNMGVMLILLFVVL